MRGRDGIIARNNVAIVGAGPKTLMLFMGQESPQRLTDELTDSFCSTDLLVARTLDGLANPSVGHYMESWLSDSMLRILPTAGHAIHMTHPALVRDEIISSAG